MSYVTSLLQSTESLNKFLYLQFCVFKCPFGLKIFLPFVRVCHRLENVFVNGVRHHDKQIAKGFVAFKQRLDDRVRELCVGQIDVEFFHVKADFTTEDTEAA